MTFYEEMRRVVLGHKAINNTYLDRFQSGDLDDSDLREFAVEFYNFARFFPQILVSQLVNTEDEQVADELTKVLYSELGDGQTRNRHELLYRDFCDPLGSMSTRPCLAPCSPQPALISRGWNDSTATAITPRPWVHPLVLRTWQSR